MAASVSHDLDLQGIRFQLTSEDLEKIAFTAAATGYFFTCSEHPEYPLGKPFGPFDSESICRSAMARHARATGHIDMVIWSGPAGAPVTLSTTDRSGRACFVVGDCVKNSGDSSHYRKTLDVDCDLPAEEAKKKLLVSMMEHYLRAHVSEIGDVDALLADMAQNIKIRHYSVSSSAVVNAKELEEFSMLDSSSNRETELKRSQIYAPPNLFGPWSIVASHIGRVTYKISVEAIGSTIVFGEVRFFGENNQQVVRAFHGEIRIATGDSIGNIEVRLKGVPLGSSCWVDVTP